MVDCELEPRDGSQGRGHRRRTAPELEQEERGCRRSAGTREGR
jgi:hypothetical protein